MNARNRLVKTVRQLVRRYFHYRLYQKMALPATQPTPLDSFGFAQPDGQIQTGNHHRVKE